MLLPATRQLLGPGHQACHMGWVGHRSSTAEHILEQAYHALVLGVIEGYGRNQPMKMFI